MSSNGMGAEGWFRRATVNGLVCAVAYGAAANLLTFVRPALAGPAGGSLAGPMALQVVATAFGLLAALAVAAALALAVRAGIPGLSRFGAAGMEVCGALALGFAAAVLAIVNGQHVLLACALLTMALAVAAGFRAAGRLPIPRAVYADAWAAALLLAVVPYLADVGPFGWSRLEAAVASFATAAVVAVGYWRYRRPSGKGWPAIAAAPLLAVVLTAGLFGSAVLQAGSGPSRAVPSVRRASGAPPNVVLIAMDSVRADHTSLHGYSRDTTPALRSEWTSGATLYTRAFATSDWTLPSTASLFTGLLPTRHRAITSGEHLQSAISENAKTLTERLRAVGYATYGIVANHGYLSPRFGFGRGFDYYSCRRATTAFGVKPYLLTAAAWRLLPPTWRKENRSAESVTREAVRLLRDHRSAGAGSFFVFLSYMDAHVPYLPPEAYRRKFGEPPPRFSWGRYHAMESAVLSGKRPIRPDERRDLEDDYDAGIAYIDDSLRLIFDELRQLGLFDNSLIIVTSDHGEMFGDSGVVGHGAGLFTKAVHVPLLVKYPGQRQAATVEDVASGADILPTVLAAVGLEAPAAMDGRNLLDQNAAGEPMAVSESFELDWLVAHNRKFAGEERAAFVGPVVHRVLRDGTTVSATWQDEANRQSGAKPPQPRLDLIAKLRALGEESSRLPLVPVADPALVETLRSLGYLGR